MTSGYPRRRSRWESSFANPRSWSRTPPTAAPALGPAPAPRGAFRFARVRGRVSAEAREVHLEARGEVPHGPINPDAGDPLHEARVRRELAPARRRPPADVDHDDVAGLRAID